MKIEYPGLLKERLPSGGFRYRVRVEGKPSKRIKLSVEPSHKEFREIYLAARRGIYATPETPPEEKALPKSIEWLTHKHIAALERKVSFGHASLHTLKKRKYLMEHLRKECGNYPMIMPSHHIVGLRDKLAETPAWADSMVEGIRSMYAWAVEAGIVDNNPAIGVKRIDKNKGGAVPWSLDDLQQFRHHHPPGTTAHLCLTILMFTACRIGDAIYLGPANEHDRDGVRCISWQPIKKGSAPVEIPMMPPLLKATRFAAGHDGPYLLTKHGQPFRSPDSLGAMMRRWTKQAGLEGRSAHGIRKAVGHLLAEQGCTQYQIMCIHGHTQARTSETYTVGVERRKLAAEAVKKMEGFDW